MGQHSHAKSAPLLVRRCRGLPWGSENNDKQSGPMSEVHREKYAQFLCHC